MPRPRYQIADADIAVVHRWVQSKFHETAPRDPPTTEQQPVAHTDALKKARPAVAPQKRRRVFVTTKKEYAKKNNQIGPGVSTCNPN
jgi:hypothetical protein